MVRLSDLSKGEAENLLRLPCPQFDDSPLSVAPDLRAARVALVTSAGISMKDDETFQLGLVIIALFRTLQMPVK